ncbi:hypothetical protein EI94DRAFT_1796421 [Lactarius quietus]|nr:hypothetical protein EI94DRAFT_1796421 [Lactarius quietus]
MPLRRIIWNMLWAKQLPKQVEAMDHILLHYATWNLEAHSAEIASLRNIGWHGESLSKHDGSHLTINFLRWNGMHITMHHVYRYDSMEGWI